MPTRDEIMAAAREVITTRGVVGATTKQIARTAGCSEGSIYNHFADKDELVVAVMTEQPPAFVAYCLGLEEKIGRRTVRRNLTELAELAVAFYREILPMIGPSFSNPDLRERHRAIALKHDRGPHTPLNAVSDYLAGERRLGRVNRRCDPDAAAALLLGACFQHAAMVHGLGEDLLRLAGDDFPKLTVKSLLVGLEPEKGR